MIIHLLKEIKDDINFEIWIYQNITQLNSHYLNLLGAFSESHSNKTQFTYYLLIRGCSLTLQDIINYKKSFTEPEIIKISIMLCRILLELSNLSIAIGDV